MNNPSAVFVLSADPLIEMVVRHLLPADQFDVQRTDQRGEFLTMLEDAALLNQEARLAVLDMPEMDADGIAFVRDLHILAGKPLLVLTSDPGELVGRLEPAVRLLDRPPRLDQLQAALRAALAEPAPPATPVAPTATRRGGWFVSIVGGVVLTAVAAILLLPVLGVPGMPNLIKEFIGTKEETEPPLPLSVKLLPDQEDAFELPAEVVSKMNIPAPFQIPATPRPRTLLLSGTLAFDPDRLARIQSRFAGEVVALGEVPSGETSLPRPLQYGNTVKRGQLLAVVWSKDLGEKKSELVDGLSQLSLDQETLKKLEAIEGSVSQAVIRQTQRNVSASLNLVNRAERTLRIWKVPEEEIDAIKAEANRIIDRKGKRDADREKDWAKVEVRAPLDGVIVEKNVVRGNIVDTTQDLYKVADLDALAVYAHVYEEDLRELQRLRDRTTSKLVPWRVNLTSDPGRAPLETSGIKRLGFVIDPNQHTDLVMGIVANPKGQLRVGQFVSAEVDLPAPPEVVSIPVAALDEDGDASHVLVQLDPKQPRYALRRVRVVRRFLDYAYVTRKVSEAERASGFRSIEPGEWVVTGGAVQLKAALEEARARAKVQK